MMSSRPHRPSLTRSLPDACVNRADSSDACTNRHLSCAHRKSVSRPKVAHAGNCPTPLLRLIRYPYEAPMCALFETEAPFSAHLKVGSSFMGPIRDGFDENNWDVPAPCAFPLAHKTRSLFMAVPVGPRNVIRVRAGSKKC